MSYQEIRALTPEELKARLVLEQKNLHQVRFAHAISPVEDPMRLRKSRKLIAKLETAQNTPRERN